MSAKPTYEELEERVQALARVEYELDQMKVKLLETEQHNSQFLGENSAGVICRMDIETHDMRQPTGRKDSECGKINSSPPHGCQT